MFSEQKREDLRIVVFTSNRVRKNPVSQYFKLLARSLNDFYQIGNTKCSIVAYWQILIKLNVCSTPLILSTNYLTLNPLSFSTH